jgi:transposase
MGKAIRTTKLLLDLGERRQGGANAGKCTFLIETVALLTVARAFYLDFFLAHADKLAERVSYYSEKHLELRERAISANELLTWAESCTVETREHPHPSSGWNFSQRFPDLPVAYRRSVIKDAIGKARSYLAHRANWEKSGQKKGRPGNPGASDHPTLYKGTWELDLSDAVVKNRFVRLKVYDGLRWQWVNYPLKCSRCFQQRSRDGQWEQESPLLILTKEGAALHFPQTRLVEAKKVKESKLDPDLVTVAVDLNVRNLAVITVRRAKRIIETIFVTDHGLDQARYRHLKKIARRQWQTGKPVKGERSNQDLWRHVRRMNEDAAYQVAHRIVGVCAKYPGCVLLFERLRKIKPKAASKSRRMNRRAANQLRGKINQYAREQAFATCATCTVEVNPHGTSQYCSRCGKPGERFSYRAGQRVGEKWGKLFWCPHCHYQVQADFNASANVHHSFFQEFHWKPHPKWSG